MKCSVFWDITLCSLLKVKPHFEQPPAFMLVYSLALSLTQYGGNVFFQNGG
jgi:hypothetical protein